MEFNLDIVSWLKSLDFDEYVDQFIENSIDMEVLLDLNTEDLKELGVNKIGHRKLLLKAILNLQNYNSENSSEKSENEFIPNDNLFKLCKILPSVIASPLKEYLSENNAGMKLWYACDTTELLIRFLVILGVSDFRKQGNLSEQLLKQFWGKIEMPTLGAWMAMAKSLAYTKDKTGLLVPETHDYVNGPLSDLIYGSENPGSPDTSFLALRNRLAHGGGLNQKEAIRLLENWQEKFENCLQKLDWISQIKILGINSGVSIELNGDHSNKNLSTLNDQDRPSEVSDGVYVIRNEEKISLWPLVLFAVPQLSSTKGSNPNGTDPITQVYVRKDVVRLQFTPIAAEGFSQTEKGEDALDAFQSLFGLDRQKNETDKQFVIQSFTREINRDAAQMVGRHDEQIKIEECISSIKEGLIWLTGSAGIGKSFLTSRLMRDQEEKFHDTNTLLLSYRFKEGDNARCNREAFVNFVIERSKASNILSDVENVNNKGTALDKLKSCLNNLKKNKQLIIIIDGLDELHIRDKDFANDMPGSLKYRGVIWVCIGRPEPLLQDLFKLKNAIIPFPNGLPPMCLKDIRGMILEKIGPLKKKLLQQDQEKNQEIVNPFIDLVSTRAEGLPLYIKYVIGDVLSNKYRVLDGNEVLPDSLHSYHEQLLDGLGIGDLKYILTPLATLLAVSYEPLSLNEIQSIFIYRKIILNDEDGKKLIENGLSTIASMLRRSPDPEGEEGYTLFHYSLREHILKSAVMVTNVRTAKEAFCELALKPDDYPSLTNYLYRTGIDHLIDTGKLQEAGHALLNFDRLETLFALGKTPSDINGYWSKLPITTKQIDACYLNKFRPLPIVSTSEFGDGSDWARFLEHDIYGVEDGDLPCQLDDFWSLELQKKHIEGLVTDNPNQEKEIFLLDELEKELEGDLSDISDIEALLSNNQETDNKESDIEDYSSYCSRKAKDYDDMEETGLRLSLYHQLADFFLLGKFTHSGVEISKRICRVLLVESGATKPETIMAHVRLSGFYAQWDGQNTETEINQQHLFYNNKVGVRHHRAYASFDQSSSSCAPIIFRYGLKLIWDNLGFKSPLVPKLLASPSIMLPTIGNLNIRDDKKILMNVSDLLIKVSQSLTEDKGRYHPSTLEVNLSLANRLYSELKLTNAQSVIDEVYNNLFNLLGLNDLRTIKALETKGNVEFELGDFIAAKISFKTLIENTEKKYSNPSIVNEWFSRLAIIEMAFNNFEFAETLCNNGLIYFDNNQSNYSYSISDDRVYILIRSILNGIKNGFPIPTMSDEASDLELENIIKFYSDRGFYEICLFYLYRQKIVPSNKITEILKLIRTIKLHQYFSINFNFLLSCLSPKQERIFRMRYRLGMNTTHSLDEISIQFEEHPEQIKGYILDGLENIRI